MSLEQIVLVAVFAPLVGCLIAGVGLKHLPKRAIDLLTCTFLGIAAAAACILFWQCLHQPIHLTITLLPWLSIGQLQANWGVYIDTLSITMIFVINVISFLVHVYSVGYMAQDPHRPRFMCYLSFFTFAMLMLVVADNLIQLFFGWEGVGLASYLLIGFWNERETANAAAMKAFIVNRVGDMGLLLAIAATFWVFNTVEYAPLFEQLANMTTHSAPLPTLEFPGYTGSALTLIAFLFLMGAMGKSAQLGLHTWLPDAMEGPTPVSALIHAATMVTAGIFLICRLAPLYELTPFVRELLLIVGAMTAVFGASVAWVQTDIKRVVAYSTCSQLGYMMLAMGCSDYTGALFHLVTHAFFKALLFLGAGAIIHTLSDEQDMRKMGGIYRFIPVTYVLMWIGSLALAGIPFFSGYYSKDRIIESAYLLGTSVATYAWGMSLIVAFLTALYTWRLLILVFHGRSRADDRVMARIHEAPASMLLPVGVLALGAVFAGIILSPQFIGAQATAFFTHVASLPSQMSLNLHATPVPEWVAAAPWVLALLGIVCAYAIYFRRISQDHMDILPKFSARIPQAGYSFLKSKWYIDDLYHKLFVRSAWSLGNFFWRWGDRGVIESVGPQGVYQTTRFFAALSRRIQTGFIYSYVLMILLGVLAALTFVLLKNVGVFYVK